MLVDLLTLNELEPPMGDLGVKPQFSFCRSFWTKPIDGENDAPENRIIHVRNLQMHDNVKIKKLGIRRGKGFHICGSHQDLDWVESLRLWIWQENGWKCCFSKQDIAKTDENTVQWFEFDDLLTNTVILEIRKSGIDGYWPSWNLAMSAFILQGEAPSPPAPRDEKNLVCSQISMDDLPDGFKAQIFDGQVRYLTSQLEVGFYLNRTGFSHLGIDHDGEHRTNINLLKIQPGLFFQGVQLNPVGQQPVAGISLRYDVTGTTSVINNHVLYEINVGDKIQYKMDWQVLSDRLLLDVERHADADIRCWTGSVWMIGFESRAASTQMIGKITKDGQTGGLTVPSLMHVPNFGTLKIESDSPDVFLRSDALRPQDMSTLEIKLGEIPQPEGDYILQKGTFKARIEFSLVKPDISLRKDTPAIVRRAVEKTTFTALTYRPDTATLSNNSISLHCPICMDMWSANTTRIGKLLPDLTANDLLKTSLERWLDGGQGYTSGRLMQDGIVHAAEDEYLMTGAACFLGLADYLESCGTETWVDHYTQAIEKQLQLLKARDIDNDGLIESIYRTGTNGTGQWSTCWWDVISFGWKDAFSNAVLYAALVKLSAQLKRFGKDSLYAGLDDWALKLNSNYFKTFYNPDTGWLAGWRCKDDKLHDHAFLFVNGAAVSYGLVEAKPALEIMQRLWNEFERVGVPDAQYGLPGNLWHIPDHDLADIMQGYPLGFYQNGGRTTSQSRHFINGLYTVGMDVQADELVKQISKGLAEGLVFGGAKSGVDWRYWDDRPSGYEGLLTDQFGVLATILERYKTEMEIKK